MPKVEPASDARSRLTAFFAAQDKLVAANWSAEADDEFTNECVRIYGTPDHDDDLREDMEAVAREACRETPNTAPEAEERDDA